MALQISPSVLTADLSALADEVARIPNADWVHVDVMDNHFVPNLTVGLPVVESLLRHAALPVDCHLMIDDPDRWAPGYAEAGAKSVTFHAEAARDARATAAAIRRAGARVGLALKPATRLEDWADLLPEIDMLLVMTVEPGFGGQSFMADQLPKVRLARERVRAGDLQVWIQVDGGVSEKTIEDCVRAGADVLVAGSAVYREPDPAAVVARLRALAEQAAAAPPAARDAR